MAVDLSGTRYRPRPRDTIPVAVLSCGSLGAVLGLVDSVSG